MLLNWVKEARAWATLLVSVGIASWAIANYECLPLNLCAMVLGFLALALFCVRSWRSKGIKQIGFRARTNDPKLRVYRACSTILTICALPSAIITYRADYLNNSRTVVAFSHLAGPTNDFGINRSIQQSLEKSAQAFPDVVVKVCGSVSDATEAKRRAKLCGSDLFIWGWYVPTRKEMEIVVNVVPARPLHIGFNSGNPIVQDLADLDQFRVQGRVAQTLQFSELMLGGIARYNAGDFKGALQRLSRASEVGHGVGRNYPLLNTYFADFWIAQTETHISLATPNVTAQRRWAKDAIQHYTVFIRNSREHAIAYCGRASALMADNQVFEAVKDFVSAIHTDRTDATCLANYGSALLTLRRPKSAIKYLTEALGRDATMPAARIDLGMAYRADGDYERAEHETDAVATIAGWEAVAYYHKAIFARERGQNERAISYYTKSLQFQPSAVVLGERGATYDLVGNRGAALRDFHEALVLDRTSTIALINRGVLLAEEGRYADALRDFKRAKTIDPANSSSYFNEAQVHVDRGEWAKAIADYTIANRLMPNDIVMHYFLGNTFASMHQLDAARMQAHIIIRLQPQSAYEAYLKGRACFYYGTDKCAIDNLTLSEREGIKSPELYSTRAQAFLASGELLRALQDYRAASSLQPDNAEYIKKGAYLELVLGDYDGVTASLDRLAQFGSRFEGMAIAIKLYAEGYTLRAHSLFAVATARYPKEPIALYSLGLCDWRLNHLVKARKELRDAVHLMAGPNKAAENALTTAFRI